MTKQSVRDAISEAKRFIKKAEIALKSQEVANHSDLWSSKESGAARRSSMDLTRALADMRRSR